MLSFHVWKQGQATTSRSHWCLVSLSVLRRTGGLSGGIPPDPIPNSAVKASCAHGTAAQAAGESVAASPTKDTQITPLHNAKCKAPRALTGRGAFVCAGTHPGLGSRHDVLAGSLGPCICGLCRARCAFGSLR